MTSASCRTWPIPWASISTASTALVPDKPVDTTSPSVHRDPKKCIVCGRCVTVLGEIQSVSAIGMVNRGFDVNVNTFFKEGLGNSSCVNCGQCTVFCPTGALRERSRDR